MADVSWTAPEQVRLWASLDVRKHSIVAATLAPVGGTPELHSRLVGRCGRPAERSIDKSLFNR